MDDGFRSGYEAIGWALRRVNTPIIDGPSIWELGRKEGSRDFMPGLDQWDKVAEAALILKNMERACKVQHRTVIMTYFTGGTVRETAILIEYLAREFQRDRWFVMEVVLHWAKGKKMRHTTQWWAKKHGVSQSTITRCSQRIRQRLDDLFQFGMGILDEALVESGHVVRA